MSSVFVTGGSGFVGGRLIERLVAEGHAVRALARSAGSAERTRSRGAEPVPGELADGPALRAAAEGCELAFHAARLLPGEHAPPLTRFAFWVSSQECTIRIDKAVGQLGYAPVRSIAEGLAGLREASRSA